MCMYAYVFAHVYVYKATSHLRGYAGVSAKVPGGQDAEGVRRESEWPLAGSRSEPPRE